MKTPTDKLAKPRELAGDYRVSWSEDDYRGFDAYGSTLVRAADRSIDAFRYKLVREYDSESMRMGSLVHMAVLEPEQFDEIARSVPPQRPHDSRSWRDKHLETASLFVEECPEPIETEYIDDWVDWAQDDSLYDIWGRVADRKTCAGKSASKCLEYGIEDGFDELVEHYQQDGVEFDPDASLPSAEDIEQAKQCRQSVLDHPKAGNLIEQARTETSFVWSESPRDLDIPVKGRTDLEIRLGDGTTLLGDLKSRRRETTEYGMRKHVSDYNSHAQAAGYCRGYEQATGREVDGYFYIAVQYEPPFHCRVFLLDDEALDAGLERYLNGITNISKVHELPDCYGGPSDEIIHLSLKEWEL